MSNIPKSLSSIDPRDSGIKNFDRQVFNSELNQEIKKGILEHPDNYFHFFNLLIFEKYNEILDAFKQDPSLLSNRELKAIKILSQILLDHKLSNLDIYPFVSDDLELRKKISSAISREIFGILSALIYNIENFRTQGQKILTKLISNLDVLPELKIFLLKFVFEDWIFRGDNFDFFQNQTVFVELINSLQDEYRLYFQALLERLQGNQGEAERLLLNYRDIDKDFLEPTLVKISSIAFEKPEEIFGLWNKLLEEVDKEQARIEKFSGLNSQTCELFACVDCCTYTYPTMSYTEFLYLKNWLITNNYDLASLQAQAEAVQQEHERLYGERLKIIDTSQETFPKAANPWDYKFTCPFLSDGRCSCYAARPLLCRGFGFSTNNGISIKACNYYRVQYQNNVSPLNERYVYDLEPIQSLAVLSDKAMSKPLKASIVAWFTDTRSLASPL